MPIKVKAPGSREQWVPDQLQKIAVKYLLEHAAAGLLLDPGAGKTAISYAAFKLLKEEGLVERALVIAPKRVAQLTWPEEAAKWQNFKDLSVEFIHGQDKEKRFWESEADIVVTNFESLPWLYDITKTKTKKGVRVDVNHKRAKQIRQLGFDVLIIDELSKLKHHGSGRHKIMKAVTHLFDRRWGLTGSIASNGLMGLFGQCLILDEGRTFGRYITHFRNEYFDKDIFNQYSYTLKDGAEELIYERMAPLCLRLDETDQGTTIPAVTSRVRNIELPHKIRKVYDELEDDLITQFKKKTITAANSAVASGKLRQVCSGAAYIEEDIDAVLAKHSVPTHKKPKEWLALHEEKLNALDELMEELEGQPMLIAYDFRFTLERLQTKYKNVAFIGGGTKDEEAERYKKQWLEGKLQFLFAHPQAAAHGLNLQEWGTSYPAHICFLDPIWDYELYDQFIRRVRRRGNKKKRVFVHHIMAKDTIDDKMMSVLGTKRRTQNALYEALKELTQQRLGR